MILILIISPMIIPHNTDKDVFACMANPIGIPIVQWSLVSRGDFTSV